MAPTLQQLIQLPPLNFSRSGPQRNLTGVTAWTHSLHASLARRKSTLRHTHKARMLGKTVPQDLVNRLAKPAIHRPHKAPAAENSNRTSDTRPKFGAMQGIASTYRQKPAESRDVTGTKPGQATRLWKQGRKSRKQGGLLGNRELGPVSAEAKTPSPPKRRPMGDSGGGRRSMVADTGDKIAASVPNNARSTANPAQLPQKQ